MPKKRTPPSARPPKAEAPQRGSASAPPPEFVAAVRDVLAIPAVKALVAHRAAQLAAGGQ